MKNNTPCNKKYSSRAALYTHFVDVHDHQKKIWPKYT